MNRRSFLSGLLATFVADPERLLWVPGKKTISIPKPLLAEPEEKSLVTDFFRVGDVVTFEGRYVIDPVTRKPTRRLQEYRVTAVHPHRVDLWTSRVFCDPKARVQVCIV